MKDQQEALVSIIMPVMHNDQYLKLALESVKKQLYTNYELLIIGCSDVIESIRISNPINDKTLYIDSQEITDSGGRRNIGIQKAKGKYILFLDSDDEFYSKESVEILFNTIENSNYPVVGGSCIIKDESRKRYYYRKDLINYNFPIEVNFREFQKEVGFYRFIYLSEFIKSNILFRPLLRFQDSVFLVETLILIKSFYLIPNIIYIYRKGHKNIIWNENNYIDHIKGVMLLIDISSKLGYYKLAKRMFKNLQNNKKIRKLNNKKIKNSLNKKIAVNIIKNFKLIKYFPYTYLKTLVLLIGD